MPAVALEIPEKPKTPATSETTKNKSASFSTLYPFKAGRSREADSTGCPNFTSMTARTSRRRVGRILTRCSADSTPGTRRAVRSWGMHRITRHMVTGRRMLAFLAGPGRTWLLLSGAAALPLLLFGGWVGYLAAVQTRVEASRTAASAVDGVTGRIAAEIGAQLSLVRTLAASHGPGRTRSGGVPGGGRTGPRRTATVAHDRTRAAIRGTGSQPAASGWRGAGPDRRSDQPDTVRLEERERCWRHWADRLRIRPPVWWRSGHRLSAMER